MLLRVYMDAIDFAGRDYIPRIEVAALHIGRDCLIGLRQTNAHFFNAGPTSIKGQALARIRDDTPAKRVGVYEDLLH